MIEIFDALAAAGDPVKEEDRVVHLLASLPDPYNMLVTALEANSGSSQDGDCNRTPVTRRE